MTVSKHYRHDRDDEEATPGGFMHNVVTTSASDVPPPGQAPKVLSRKFVARRISEGETGRLKEELKCQACGKGYKHVSSLAKHLWEHTPEWNVTSKLLISKHQQVQLLEAASILVSMNEEDSADEDSPEVQQPSSFAGSSDSPSPPDIESLAHSPVPLPRTSARSISKPRAASLPHSHRGRRPSHLLSPSPAIASSLLSVATQAPPLPESMLRESAIEESPSREPTNEGETSPKSAESGAESHHEESPDDIEMDPELESERKHDTGVFGDME